MFIFNFLFDFIFEILIVLSVYFFDTPLKSLGFFLILMSINIIKSSRADILINMVNYIDFKDLNLKNRFMYIVYRTIPRVINPFSFVFMSIFTYSLYKVFGFLYSWLERPFIFFIVFYLFLALLTFVLEILVNFYIYATVKDKKVDKFVLSLEFFYFLSFAVGVALNIMGIKINSGLIQLISAILIIGKCIYDKNWKLSNYILYAISAKLLMFVLAFFMGCIAIFVCTFIYELASISIIVLGVLFSAIYAKFSALLYREYRNNSQR